MVAGEDRGRHMSDYSVSALGKITGAGSPIRQRMSAPQSGIAMGIWRECRALH